MKLTGSKTENEYRDQLICSRRSLFEDRDKKRILVFLQSKHPEMKTAYTLDWIPEQGEDIYSILVDLDKVLSVEVDRLNIGSEPSLLESISLSKYKNSLSKTNRIKLAVALDLAQADIKG